MIRELFHSYSTRARQRRARLFHTFFALNESSRVLDLGSERGDHIHSVLHGTAVCPENVHIADIDGALIEDGKKRYGYQPVLIPEHGRLPFADGYFDLVYCSSVIEHVTVAKGDVWKIRSGRRFSEQASARQQAFAAEIKRLGRSYFVQTPNRWFPLESHSWLPFVSYLPRALLLVVLRLSNRIWVKQTIPDWHLLTRSGMARLFPDAEIHSERSLGLVKSLMAVGVKGQANQGVSIQ